MWPDTSRLLNGMPMCCACRFSHVLGPRIPLVPGASCCKQNVQWGVRMLTRWVLHWIITKGWLLPRLVVIVGPISLVGSWSLYPPIRWGNVLWSFECPPLTHCDNVNLVVPIPVSSFIHHGWWSSLNLTPHCLICASEEWRPLVLITTSWRDML